MGTLGQKSDSPLQNAMTIASQPCKLVQSVRQFATQKEVASILKVSTKTVRRWERGETTPSKAHTDGLLNLLYHPPKSGNRGRDEFTFIDLFAGIGGMRLGFEAVGGRCVYTSEWNRFAQETYRANFSCAHEISGDITQVNKKLDIPDHDVLVAGFPCQPFSIAGVSKKNSLGRKHGFADETQGTLFFDIVEILREKQPHAFLLENVKNLVSHDKGRTFEVIIGALEELGYTVGDDVMTRRIVDAKHFVPQHRERTFIVGFRKDTVFSWDDIPLPSIESGPKLERIFHPEDGTEDVEPPFTQGTKAKVAQKYILSDKLWKYLKNYAAKHKAKGNGFGYGLVGPNDVSRTLSARYYKDGSEILVARGPRKNPRRLTPRECSRLMGFDTDDRIFRIPVSDTQAYKQFGNAVCPLVVEEIARVMKPHIIGLKRNRSLVQDELFPCVL
ncbi:MAG: DNA (cytosine-5-)-methyltransferase [Verrucomicrobiales bacterium]|nr:DNA (cytosine-5-)-methyltransferase [Verrucomicrobiales bacterium]